MKRTNAHPPVMVAFAAALIVGCPRQQGAPVTASPVRAQPDLWRSDVAPVSETAPDPMLEKIRSLAARTRTPTALPVDGPAASGPGVTVPVSAAPGAPPTVPAPVPAPAGAADGTSEQLSILLGPGDALDVVVGGQPEFSGEVVVREDGTVALPTTSDLVNAGGGTPLQLADAIASAIWPAYTRRRPTVSVVLRRSPRLAYYVFGAVRTPGRYDMPPTGMSLLDAVMRASRPERAVTASSPILGFEPVAGARYERVYVFARGPGAEPDIVDLAAEMRTVAVSRRLVQPGQTIVVPAPSGEWSEAELHRRLLRAPETVTAPGGRP